MREIYTAPPRTENEHNASGAGLLISSGDPEKYPGQVFGMYVRDPSGIVKLWSRDAGPFKALLSGGRSSGPANSQPCLSPHLLQSRGELLPATVSRGRRVKREWVGERKETAEGPNAGTMAAIRSGQGRAGKPAARRGPDELFLRPRQTTQREGEKRPSPSTGSSFVRAKAQKSNGDPALALDNGGRDDFIFFWLK